MIEAPAAQDPRRALFTEETVSYVPAAVAGMTPLLSSAGDGAEPGVLRPLEAVIYH
jgi:hypothetical protein